MNNPTYVSPGYNGAGACLHLNKTLKQSIIISSPPFLNMSYTSFTLQAWIYANTFSDTPTYNDNSIFVQFEKYVTDHALHCVIRNHRIYLGFHEDDTSGNVVGSQ